MNSEQENFLSRWSRRKQIAKDEALLAEPEEPLKEVSLEADLDADQALEVQAVDQELEPEPAPALTDEDMPPIESLNEESDFSMFMSRGVSDELRNLALKKLFKATVFNVRDGLDEYDEDYTSFEKLGDIVTCDMKHAIEMEAKKKLEKEAELMNEDDVEQDEIEMDDPDTETVEEIEAIGEEQVLEESRPITETEPLHVASNTHPELEKI